MDRGRWIDSQTGSQRQLLREREREREKVVDIVREDISEIGLGDF